MQPAPLAGTATIWFLITIHENLRMQPAPLAGTATLHGTPCPHYARDATRTPRGDGNDKDLLIRIRQFDATRTPRGDGNGL